MPKLDCLFGVVASYNLGIVNADALQKWLIPVTSAAGILSTAIAAWVAVLNYGMKARAEARLAESARVERDINLLRLFTELMNIAHSRISSQLSERAVEHITEELNNGEASERSGQGCCDDASWTCCAGCCDCRYWNVG